MAKNISHNLSPAAAISKYIKETDPTSKVVFIGPCTAKKMEFQKEEVRPYIDSVITFEELQALFDSKDLDITSMKEDVLDNASYYGRIFARSCGLTDAVKEAALSGKPFLGICLGLHLLFEESEESPGAKGLGILKGKIRKIPLEEGIKVPHMGWNSLEVKQHDGVFASAKDGDYVYFVHSYYLTADNPEEVAARTVYGSTVIDAAGKKGNLCAVQFHPEKSGSVGLNMLRNFAGMEAL